MTTKESPRSVEDTVSRLKGVLESKLAALDLPLRVLVWADGGRTKLSYDGPNELAARYGLSDELAGRLSAIDGVTDAAIEQ